MAKSCHEGRLLSGRRLSPAFSDHGVADVTFGEKKELPSRQKTERNPPLETQALPKREPVRAGDRHREAKTGKKRDKTSPPTSSTARANGLGETISSLLPARGDFSRRRGEKRPSPGF